MSINSVVTIGSNDQNIVSCSSATYRLSETFHDDNKVREKFKDSVCEIDNVNNRNPQIVMRADVNRLSVIGVPKYVKQ